MPVSGYNEGVDFQLRDYRREDLETLWAIDQQCFLPGVAYSRAELATYIGRKGAFTLVAELGGTVALETHAKRPGDGGVVSRIAGFIVGEQNRSRVGHIISIDVRPESRRLGLGSQLLTTAEKRLRIARCESVFLETAVDNGSALTFYKRHGYDIVKIVPRYYSNGVDAFVLEKQL